MPAPQVAHTAEFQRISSLPRRVWATEDLAEITRQLTSILRTQRGSMSLRAVQALALYYAGTEQGLFGAIGVGEGKTLITLLLPLVLGAKRPLLLLPASLIEKTQRNRLELAKDWRIPNTLRTLSCEMLGRVQSADDLHGYQPDLIVVDEAHRLKNRRAAVTRRVARYMYDFPETVFCAVSGSFMDKSLKEFAHIVRWCLKLNAPVPMTNEETEEWAEALDQNVDPMCRRKPGALLEWADEGDEPEYVRARVGFRKRLTETPGVVATLGEGESVGCSIYLRGIRHRVSQATEAYFNRLRNEWATPDGWELMTGVDVWRHAQELALGLFYRWNPRPPDEWLEARRAWGQFVRATIAHGRTYDSELHVANACDAGLLDGSALAEWRKVRPTFTPNVEAVWCDDSALEAAADWMAKEGGLVWTEHRFFAERLVERTGAKYYGAGGYAPDGRYIEDAEPGVSAIASIDANREGKNLQGIWSRNLIVCPPRSAAWLEQLIARTHRPGQEADEVIVDILLGCRENFDAITGAIEDARAIQEMTGKTQKLLLADATLPREREIDALNSPRWVRDVTT